MARVVQEVLNGVRKCPQLLLVHQSCCVISGCGWAQPAGDSGLFSYVHSAIRELLGKSLSDAGRAVPEVRRDRWRLHTWVLGSVLSLGCLRPAREGAELGHSGRGALLSLPWGMGTSLGSCHWCWEKPQIEKGWLNLFLAQDWCSAMDLNFASWTWGLNMSYFLFKLGAAALAGKSWARCWWMWAVHLPCTFQHHCYGIYPWTLGDDLGKSSKTLGLPVSAVGSHLGCFMLQEEGMPSCMKDLA